MNTGMRMSEPCVVVVARRVFAYLFVMGFGAQRKKARKQLDDMTCDRWTGIYSGLKINDDDRSSHGDLTFMIARWP